MNMMNMNILGYERDELVLEISKYEEDSPEYIAVQLKIDDIDFKLHAENVKNRMKINIEAFANGEFKREHEHKKKVIEFFTSNSRYSLMYGPTQAGKTQSSFEMVRVAMDLGLITIVSTDNRSDQLNQMFKRFTVSLASFSEVGVFKITDANIQKNLKETLQRTKKIVIFCMNNSSQLKKLTNIVSGLIKDSLFTDKVFILSDEGDVTIKDSQVNVKTSEQAESHKQWIDLEKLFNESDIDYKRTFLTATPEACVNLYPVESLLEIEIPQTYIGYKDINYYPVPDDFDETRDLSIILDAEIGRRLRREESGAILISTERKVTSGQCEIFENLIQEYPGAMISTYNGEGIYARPTESKFGEFTRILNIFINKYNRINKPKIILSMDDNAVFYKIRNMSISDFYKIAKDSEHYAVVRSHVTRNVLCFYKR